MCNIFNESIMTKRDFFIIIIKLFGLYALITTVFGIAPSIIAISQIGFDASTCIYALISITLLSLLLIYILNQSDKIVTFLKLEKGFDSDYIKIESLDKKSIIQLGLIIIGGIVFIENIPSLLTTIFYMFKAMSQQTIDYNQTDFRTNENYIYLTKDAISVLLGYLVLTNHDKLATKLM